VYLGPELSHLELRTGYYINAIDVTAAVVVNLAEKHANEAAEQVPAASCVRAAFQERKRGRTFQP
jgi:hypothetical protein